MEIVQLTNNLSMTTSIKYSIIFSHYTQTAQTEGGTQIDTYVSRTTIVFDIQVWKTLATEKLVFKDLQEQILNYAV